jgi:hypothetical protein
MKAFVITYSLTFSNSMDIEAETREEAEKKFWEHEREEGELDALDGVEDGYTITKIEEAPHAE